ncbi:alpha-keto acid decarboxylase family protein [Catenuloplanes japonicus]|uniref:alpha-keto acid decarboxylase family protein n=1 Tax=Catenuloplanes japonicus TaxID=33876 RepID=UPI0005266C60|nr:thiamine pyrophosphate-dependent enzyme [Catenuloplanes japonicus]
MKPDYTVGQYLVDRLTQLGLGHLFSIAGDYSIGWVNGYVAPSTIEVIEEVNELNAGYAADGYARLKGIGALAVTYSAGALCTVNAIAGAYVEKVPVVLINGTPSIKRTLAFEQTGVSSHHFITGRETDLQSFEHLTAAAVRVDNPDLAPMLIDYALSTCITDRRPVYIELLQDMIDLSCPRPIGTLSPARVMSDPANLQESITRIRERLAAAAKPVVWVGVEVDRFGLHEKVLSLLHQLKIPYVTELLSKAVLSEDDTLFAGVFDGQASSAEVKDLIQDSDLVLALGVWLTDINSLGWNVDFGRTAFVSLDTVKDGTFFSPQVALEHLIDGLLADPPACAAPAARPRAAAHTEPQGDQLTYQGFYDTIAQYVDENTVIGADASMNYFGSLLLKVPTAGGFVAQSSYSAIGYSAPAATGMCLAKKDRQRVLVFSGDGGFQMTAQCLSVQTRFGLDPIIFVLNNGIYGVEQWLADASVFASGEPFFKSCVLHPWNYSKLADVFGCQGWRASTYVELKEAVTGALANTGSPSIVEVVVDGRSIPDNAKWKTN